MTRTVGAWFLDASAKVCGVDRYLTTILWQQGYHLPREIESRVTEDTHSSPKNEAFQVERMHWSEYSPGHRYAPRPIHPFPRPQPPRHTLASRPSSNDQTFLSCMHCPSFSLHHSDPYPARTSPQSSIPHCPPIYPSNAFPSLPLPRSSLQDSPSPSLPHPFTFSVWRVRRLHLDPG